MNSTVDTTEVFMLYNERKGNLLVEYIRMERSEEAILADIMVVEYKGKEYKLYWDDYYSYYSGEVAGEKGFVL